MGGTAGTENKKCAFFDYTQDIHQDIHMAFWGSRRSNDALWEEFSRLRAAHTTLRGEFDDLADKHERLRGVFYKARAGLADNGEPIAPKRQAGETREEFKARKLRELRTQPE